MYSLDDRTLSCVNMHAALLNVDVHQRQVDAEVGALYGMALSATLSHD